MHLPKPAVEDDDTLVVQGMRDRGGDLSRPVKIDYYVYAFAKADALKAAIVLCKPEFHCAVRPPSKQIRDPAMSEFWLIDLSETHIVSVAHLKSVSNFLDAEARRFKNTAYDGYEADEPPRLK